MRLPSCKDSLRRCEAPSMLYDTVKNPHARNIPINTYACIPVKKIESKQQKLNRRVRQKLQNKRSSSHLSFISIQIAKYIILAIIFFPCLFCYAIPRWLFLSLLPKLIGVIKKLIVYVKNRFLKIAHVFKHVQKLTLQIFRHYIDNALRGIRKFIETSRKSIWLKVKRVKSSYFKLKSWWLGIKLAIRWRLINFPFQASRSIWNALRKIQELFRKIEHQVVAKVRLKIYLPTKVYLKSLKSIINSLISLRVPMRLILSTTLKVFLLVRTNFKYIILFNKNKLKTVEKFLKFIGVAVRSFTQSLKFQVQKKSNRLLSFFKRCYKPVKWRFARPSFSQDFRLKEFLISWTKRKLSEGGRLIEFFRKSYLQMKCFLIISLSEIPAQDLFLIGRKIHDFIKRAFFYFLRLRHPLFFFVLKLFVWMVEIIRKWIKKTRIQLSYFFRTLLAPLKKTFLNILSGAFFGIRLSIALLWVGWGYFLLLARDLISEMDDWFV